MFGYVKTFQPELKMGEFEQYRGVYCSLCKQLGKSYGFWSRMTLSYDFTFLALFHMALSPVNTSPHLLAHASTKQAVYGKFFSVLRRVGKKPLHL